MPTEPYQIWAPARQGGHRALFRPLAGSTEPHAGLGPSGYDRLAQGAWGTVAYP